MYGYVHSMIAKKVVLVKVIVKGKADVGNGTVVAGTLKGRVFYTIQCKALDLDVVVIEDVWLVVKDKRNIERV